MSDIPLVLFLGTLSTLQTHLAKALERQGIEVFEQLKARFARDGQPAPLNLKKPAIYTVGVILNNTLFIWSTLAQPHGPPALFSSLFGVGLILLMAYAAWVLREPVSRREVLGAGAILLGTLGIGLENIQRAELDRFTMNLPLMLAALGIWLAVCLVMAAAAGRSRNPAWMALAYGLLAGTLGSLDPFFKGVGQNYGGQPGVLPATWTGGVIFGASFVIGFIAFVVTQVGFARKARASLLVPAYNAAYIAMPVFWQALLLPAYQFSATTLASLLLIISGVGVMQPVKLRGGAGR